MDVKEKLSLALCDSNLPCKEGKRTSEQGFTVNELMVMLAVVMIIVGLAVPGILRVRVQARNEAFAINLLRTIAASQVAYSKSCGLGGYAVDFAVLGKPGPHLENGFIPIEFTQTESLRQSGYDFSLGTGAGARHGPLDCHGIPTRTAYLATAQPIEFGIAGSGNRSFAITDRKVIWQVRSAVAPDEPFSEPEVPLQ